MSKNVQESTRKSAAGAGVSKEKQKALDLAVSSIEKQFGKGSIMKLGQDRAVKVPSIPTGSLGLDNALGIGGVPRGRVVEVYGPEASGKTTLALTIISQAQKLGGTAVFVDAEHAFPAEFANTIGVDLDNLHVSQPDTGEEALEITDQLVRSGAIDVIVVDSVAALVPKAEIEGEMGDSHMGLQARLMSQALRKLTGSVAKSNTTVIFINQLRMKIGVMFGNPETTTGGNALKFYSSVRLDIRRIASIKDKDQIVGNRVKVKVAKNKVAAPFRVIEFDIYYNEGISRTGEVLDMAVEKNIIEKSGTWFSYGTERMGQGREAARRFLRENPEAMLEIEAKIRTSLGIPLLPGMKAPALPADVTDAEAEAEGDESAAPSPKKRGSRSKS
ncbi:MAG: recombinase RecA [Candidatus Eisenbacteria bacterium]|uniref:Protein RecA n=1 Tax=Eiseniibacteriota bacterium TaxID=2212470 RepID=A0A7Y2E9Q8_UNCEI|nr:recombinase RecA [Candidatus Eisenbacteria bacterium]